MKNVNETVLESHNPILRAPSAAPSRMLLRAAVSGLLGLGVAACGDDDTGEDDPDEHSDEHSEHEMCEEPKEPKECECEMAGGDGDGDGDGDATVDGGMMEEEVVEKEISTEDVQHTFAELKEMCDDRDGYIEIHASCAGVNTCQGFFYGDWGEDSQLVEHTCSGVNGCSGLSCFVPPEPEDGGMTGEEILELDDAWWEAKAGQYGPDPCRTCHIKSAFNEDTNEYEYDYTQMRLPLWKHENRTAENWTDRPAAHQEAIVTFGAHGFTPDGTPYSNMAAYGKYLSKVEIQRVVETMRSFAPDKIETSEINAMPGKAEE